MFSKVGSNVKSRISRSFSSVGTKQEFDRIAVRDGLTPTSNDSRGKAFLAEAANAKIADKAVDGAKRDAGVDVSPIHRDSHKKFLPPPPAK